MQPKPTAGSSPSPLRWVLLRGLVVLLSLASLLAGYLGYVLFFEADYGTAIERLEELLELSERAGG